MSTKTQTNGSKTTTFQAIKIPASSALPLVNLTLPRAGGLEKDALRLLCEETFAADDAGIDTDLQQLQTRQELAKQGMDEERISQVMQQLMSNAGASEGKNGKPGKPRLGSNVEIVCVGLAKPGNHYRGVSMYCDGNASYKKDVPVNARATKLAQACGLGERIVYGDCFMGRAHDDESQVRTHP